MDKDIQKLTQNERYDLTDKQVREIYQANTISVIENTLGILSTRQTIEDLKAENQRLKNELDKQIRINRKLVKALKEYANSGYWLTYDDEENVFMYGGNGYEIAQQVLKEVEEE